MRFIPSSLHGFLDYAVAATLIAGPLVLGFEGVAKLLAIAGGVGLILYSLLTDYSASARRLIPFPAHLAFDFAAAFVLIAAPSLFGFGDLETTFYRVIGAAVIVAVLFTQTDAHEPA